MYKADELDVEHSAAPPGHPRRHLNPEDEAGAGAGPAVRGWEECTGYRKRAPPEQRRAEMERIHKQDEEAVQQLKAQKRIEAQQLIRVSSSSKLGAPDAGTVGMKQARLAFVGKLERESDPKVKRKQRKNEEQRQRDVETQKCREEAEARRRSWQESQCQAAARDREVNRLKQFHWQAADATAPSSQTAASGVAEDGQSPSPLVGRWLHGSKPQEYYLSKEDNGLLNFDGPNPAGGRLSGILLAQNSFQCYEAELIDGDGVLFGIMRFSLIKEDDTLTVLSKFRKPGMTNWGKDNFARRAPPFINSAASKEELAADRKNDSSEGSHQSPLPAYEDQLIDPNLWQCSACTLINDSSASCCALCDNPRAQWSLQSKIPAPNTLACSSMTPNILSSEPVGITPEAQLSTAAAVSTSAPPSNGDVQIPEAEGHSGPVDFLTWLQTHRLHEYHPALVEQGFEELDDLRMANQSELDEMFKLICAKPGHMPRFRRALGAATSAAILGGPRECPVCLAGPQEGVNVALTPCGHVFCGDHAREAHGNGECPLCRARPSATQRIFA